MSKELKQFTTAKMDPAEIFGNACLKARYAVDEFTAKHGEPMYCGFANISIHPARGPFVTWCKKMEIGSNGYGGGWRISYYDMMNGQPYCHTQSMDIKEIGCQAFANVLKKYGMTAYMESRAD